MKCLETRTDDLGIRRRRYERDDGTRLTTMEVPATVLKAIGMTRVREQMKTWHRGEQRRSRASTLREAVIARLLQPRAKPTAIANELGVTEQRVRQIRQQWIKEHS